LREKLFLLTSTRAAKRLTEVFDFVWPTAAAIWNLRWQVGGYVAVVPNAPEADLAGRFIAGSGIRGANLRRACIKVSWEDQQQEFARFLLVEFCALYEAWCEGALSELAQTSALAKSLQFPTVFANNTPSKGVGHALGIVNSNLSAAMSTGMYPVFCKNKKYSKPHLEQLLTCYRYFKELRNGLVHAGGTASPNFVNAQAAYATLTPATLGTTEIPVINAHAPGDGVKVSLRGVVGFGEVVLRLICTLDAEFAQSDGAEKAFIARWKSKHGKGPVFLAHGAHAHKSRIKKLVRKLDFPTPIVTTQFEAWLRKTYLTT